MNDKIKVGITGQGGFIGTHLFNTLHFKENIILIPFEDAFFNELDKLEKFVGECDCIVHLAALNRHRNQQVIYDTNIKLVKDLIYACERTDSKTHIIFSSSSQENLDNVYGKSKREGRELFEKWALKKNSRFTGFIIPNVFGPYGNPFYNSVVATFCYQLTHNEEPKIDIDGNLKLIYVNNLADEFYKAIIDDNRNELIKTKLVNHDSEAKVTEILKTLNYFKEKYFDNGIIPKINNEFEYNLFNTFLCFTQVEKYPIKVDPTDVKGWKELLTSEIGGRLEYIELDKEEVKEISFSSNGMYRLVVFGLGEIEVSKVNSELKNLSMLDVEDVSIVDIPVWKNCTIKNKSSEILRILKWELNKWN